MPGPRVTHFNDCANVARSITEAANAAGYPWKYLPPELVRPENGFTPGITGKASQLPYVARHFRAALTSDVLHIHYATAAALLDHPYIPSRPYLLTLHGTDIRHQWADPAYHTQIQRAIDGAHAVYYTNLDTATNATTARPDATYQPPLIRPGTLPAWSPGNGAPLVVFASRWDKSKGMEKQLEFAEQLHKAAGPETRILGLDWGPGAGHARERGVTLVPRMNHSDYVRFLASADLVVGQATPMLGVSELEAMAIGVPVLCPVDQLTGPDGVPPVLQPSAGDTVGQALVALEDPVAASTRLSAREWVLAHHTADAWVPRLAAEYASAAS